MCVMFTDVSFPFFPCLSPLLPSHSFPPPFVTGPNSGQWLRDALAKAWSYWLPSDTMDTIRRCVGTAQEMGVHLVSLHAKLAVII